MVSKRKDAVSLSWSPPSSDGSSPITGYIIEKQDTKRGTWSQAGNVKPSNTEHTVGKLPEGHEFRFRIFAENEVGVSSAAEIEQPVIAKSPYGEGTRYYCIIISLYLVVEELLYNMACKPTMTAKS